MESIAKQQPFYLTVRQFHRATTADDSADIVVFLVKYPLVVHFKNRCKNSIIFSIIGSY